MPVHRGPVLTDANSVIEAHRVGAWAALSSRYRIVMVEKCVEETQTGFQKRRPEETIDRTSLVASLSEYHLDDRVRIMELQIDPGGTVLDAGEMSLWAHALLRTDDWVICGADAASMKFGYARGKRTRLVNLGSLLADIGYRPDPPLRGNYGKAWLDDLIHRMVMGLL